MHSVASEMLKGLQLLLDPADRAQIELERMAALVAEKRDSSLRPGAAPRRPSHATPSAPASSRSPSLGVPGTAPPRSDTPDAVGAGAGRQLGTGSLPRAPSLSRPVSQPSANGRPSASASGWASAQLHTSVNQRLTPPVSASVPSNQKAADGRLTTDPALVQTASKTAGQARPPLQPGRVSPGLSKPTSSPPKPGRVSPGLSKPPSSPPKPGRVSPGLSKPTSSPPKPGRISPHLHKPGPSSPKSSNARGKPGSSQSETKPAEAAANREPYLQQRSTMAPHSALSESREAQAAHPSKAPGDKGLKRKHAPGDAKGSSGDEAREEAPPNVSKSIKRVRAGDSHGSSSENDVKRASKRGRQPSSAGSRRRQGDGKEQRGRGGDGDSPDGKGQAGRRKTKAPAKKKATPSGSDEEKATDQRSRKLVKRPRLSGSEEGEVVVTSSEESSAPSWHQSETENSDDDDYESDSSEILCAVCNESADVKGNRIVVCDNEDCGNGYHQYCHWPRVPDDELDNDEDWFCMTCTEAKALDEKKGREKS